MAYTKPNIIASGTTLAQLQAGGASGHLELLIAAQAATAAPTVAPTLSETGSSGSLAATTYFAVITETNGIGETTASPAQVSGQAISGTEELVVTFPTLKTGNTARNTYVGTSSTGPFLLAASGTTASSVTISSLPTNSYAVQPPTANTTGLSFLNSKSVEECKALELIRAAKDGNLEDVFRYYGRVIRAFIEGDPISFNGTLEKLRHAHTALAMLDTMCSEAGTLIDANAGTLGGSAAPIGIPTTVRTWP